MTSLKKRKLSFIRQGTTLVTKDSAEIWYKCDCTKDAFYCNLCILTLHKKCNGKQIESENIDQLNCSGRCLSKQILPYNQKHLMEIECWKCECMNDFIFCTHCIIELHGKCVNSKKKTINLVKNFECGGLLHTKPSFDKKKTENKKKLKAIYTLAKLHNKNFKSLLSKVEYSNFQKLDDKKKINSIFNLRTITYIFNFEKSFMNKFSKFSQAILELKEFNTEEVKNKSSDNLNNENTQNNNKKDLKKIFSSIQIYLKFLKEQEKKAQIPFIIELDIDEKLNLKIEDLFDTKITSKCFLAMTKMEEYYVDKLFIKGVANYFHFLMNFIYLPKFMNNLSLQYSFTNMSPLHRILSCRDPNEEFINKNLKYEDFIDLIKNCWKYIKSHTSKRFIIRSILKEFFRIIEFHLSFDLEMVHIVKYAKYINKLANTLNSFYKKNDNNSNINSQSKSYKRKENFKINIIDKYHDLKILICYKYNDKIIKERLIKNNDENKYENNFLFQKKNNLPKNFPFLRIEEGSKLKKILELHLPMDNFLIESEYDRYINMIESSQKSNQIIFINKFKTLLLGSNKDIEDLNIFEKDSESSDRLYNRKYITNYVQFKKKYLNNCDKLNKNIYGDLYECSDDILEEYFTNEEDVLLNYLENLNEFLQKLKFDLEDCTDLTTKNEKFLRQIYLFKYNYFDMLNDIFEFTHSSSTFLEDNKNIQNICVKIIKLVEICLKKLLEHNSFLISHIFSPKIVKFLNKYGIKLEFYSFLLTHLEKQNFCINFKYFLKEYEDQLKHSYEDNLNIHNSQSLKNNSIQRTDCTVITFMKSVNKIRPEEEEEIGKFLKFISEKFSILSNIIKVCLKDNYEMEIKLMIVNIIKELHSNPENDLSKLFIMVDNHKKLSSEIISELNQSLRMYYKMFNSLSNDYLYLVKGYIDIDTVKKYLINKDIIANIQPYLRIELIGIYIKYYFKCHKILISEEFLKRLEELVEKEEINTKLILNEVYLNNLANDKDNIVVICLENFEKIHEIFGNTYFKYPRFLLEYFVNVILFPTKEYLYHIIYFNNQVDNIIKYHVNQIILKFLKAFQFMLSQLNISDMLTEDYGLLYKKFFKITNENISLEEFLKKKLADIDKNIKKLNFNNRYLNIMNSLTSFYKDFFECFNDILEERKWEFKDISKDNPDESFYTTVKELLLVYKELKNSDNYILREFLTSNDKSTINERDLIAEKIVANTFIDSSGDEENNSLDIDHIPKSRNCKKSNTKDQLDCNLSSEDSEDSEENNEDIDDNCESEDENNKFKVNQIIKTQFDKNINIFPDLKSFSGKQYFYIHLLNKSIDFNWDLFFKKLNDKKFKNKFNSHIIFTFRNQFSIFCQMSQVVFSMSHQNTGNMFLKYFFRSSEFYRNLLFKENGNFVYQLFKYTTDIDNKSFRVDALLYAYFCYLLNNFEFFLGKDQYMIPLNISFDSKLRNLDQYISIIFQTLKNLIRFKTDPAEQVNDTSESSANKFLTSLNNRSKTLFDIISEKKKNLKELFFYYYTYEYIHFVDTYISFMKNKNIITILKPEDLEKFMRESYEEIIDKLQIYTNPHSGNYENSHKKIIEYMKIDDKKCSDIYSSFSFQYIYILYMILMKNQNNPIYKKILTNMKDCSRLEFRDNLDNKIMEGKVKDNIIRKELYNLCYILIRKIETIIEPAINSEISGNSLELQVLKKNTHIECNINSNENTKEKCKKKQVAITYFVINPDTLNIIPNKDYVDFMRVAPFNEKGKKYTFLLMYFYYFSAIIKIRKNLVRNKNGIGFLMDFNVKYMEYFSLFMVLFTNWLLLFSLYYKLSTPINNSENNIYEIVNPMYFYIFIISLFHLIILALFISFGLYVEIKKYKIFHQEKKILEEQEKNREVKSSDYFSLLFDKNLLLFIYLFSIGLISISNRELNFMYSLQLFYICHFVEIMKTIFNSFKLKFAQFASASILILIITLFFSVVSNIFFKDDFMNDDVKQNLCESVGRCFIFLISNGIKSGGGLGFPIISYNDTKYWWQFVFEWLFYFFIILVMLNTINGIIVDTFQSLREENNRKKEIRDETCYVCGIKRTKFETNGLLFDDHCLEEHNFLDYLSYMYYLKNVQDMKKCLEENTNNLFSFYAFGEELSDISHKWVEGQYSFLPINVSAKLSEDKDVVFSRAY